MVMRTAFIALLMSASYLSAHAEDLLAWINAMSPAYAGVQDYTATFMRLEVLRGKQRPQEVIALKFRKPMEVYMRWLSESGKDREAIFVKGRDNDRVLVHEPGWLLGHFTAAVPTDGSDIMDRSRHPFDEIGIGRMIDLLISTFEKANAAGELRLLDRGTVQEAGRSLRLVEGILPRSPAKKYYCYRAIVTIDEGWKLPVAVKVYDWDDRLVEHYRYSDIQINPGLSDLDFDPKNPAYDFPERRFKR